MGNTMKPRVIDEKEDEPFQIHEIWEKRLRKLTGSWMMEGEGYILLEEVGG